MGSAATKPETPCKGPVNNDNSQVVQSSGFHILELHMPTVGTGVMIVTVFIALILCLFACYRYKRHQVKARRLARTPLRYSTLWRQHHQGYGFPQQLPPQAAIQTLPRTPPPPTGGRPAGFPFPFANGYKAPPSSPTFTKGIHMAASP
jgi:hypothetical protein